MNWHMTNGYFINCNNGLMHRYLMNASKEDFLVDHINKNPLDNRLVNLRFNTFSGNVHNKTKLENVTSKYYGVYWHTSLKYWISKLMKDNVSYLVGYFDTEEEAAAAYNVKARELYREFANLNVLENEQELLDLTIQKRQRSSKYRGVNWSKDKNKWKARINYKTITYHIGYFETEIEAAVAANVKVRNLCPDETNRINVIENEEEILKIIASRNDNQSSKYRGVSYNKQKQKYEAYITHNKKRHMIGYFNIEIEAAKAYNNKALELYGAEYKHLNII